MNPQLDRRALLAGLGAMAGSAALPAFAQRPASMPAVQGLSPATPQSVGMAADLDARIAAMMKEHIDAGRISGAVTAVARRNQLVHFQPHGMLDIEAGTPMSSDRLFVMMSSTKPVTGVALLQQMEEGKIALEDPVSKFIPEIRDMRVTAGPAPRAEGETADGSNIGAGRGALAGAGLAALAGRAGRGGQAETVPAAREITIKDLATHTSGIGGPAGVPAGTPNTLAGRIPYVRNSPLSFQPGTRWAYSATTGPDVLARVIEITSGVPYDRYLRERIFEPVGMGDTGHNLTDEQRARVVPRYTRQGDRWVRAGGAAAAGGAVRNPRTTFFAGSFGLQATTADYLLFETMLLNKGTIHGRRVLRPESVELMSSNLVGNLYGATGPTAGSTGFGVLVRTVLNPATCGCNRSQGAFGWGGAYGTMSWTDPRDELVAVLMIQQSVGAVQRGFERAIRQAIVA